MKQIMFGSHNGSLTLSQHQHSNRIMSQSYPTVLNFEVWISNNFLKFILQISIEFWIRNILLQKFLQNDMIFLDQFIVRTVNLGKCGVYDTGSLASGV